MPDLEGTVEYPGIDHVMSFRYTRSHGVQPGSMQFEITPQDGFPDAEGTVTLSFGDRTFEFPNCRIDYGTIRADGNGRIISLSILDERWRWQFPKNLSGFYNRLDAKNQPIEQYKKSVRELAELCCEAIDKADADVEALPDNIYPEVNWNNEKAATVLEGLASEYACRVVLQTDGNVLIAKTGEGADLPEDDLMDFSETLDTAEIPRAIRVSGAATRIDMPLKIEPVGRDTDGLIKPIDDLSYKPEGGWEGQNTVFSGVTGDEERRLALEHVYRSWRPLVGKAGEEDENGNDNSVEVPDIGTIESLDQIVMYAERSETALEDASEVNFSKAPKVFGKFWVGNRGAPSNTPESEEYKGDFSIDTDNNLIQFSEQVKKWNTLTEKFEAADLWLITGISFRDFETGELHRYEHERKLSGDTPGEHVINVEEIVQINTGTAQFDLDPLLEELVFNGEIEWIDNIGQDRLEEHANHHIQANLPLFQDSRSAEAKYMGWVDVELDGAIQQITWVRDGNGASMTASRNTESDTYTPPYRFRIRTEQQRDIVRQWKQAKKLLGDTI